jgi:transcription antitermination factor NusA-like protein
MAQFENVADVQKALAPFFASNDGAAVEVVAAVSEPGELAMIAVRSIDQSRDAVNICSCLGF